MGKKVEQLKNIIAIIDDEPNIRETATFILELEGYDVVTACNGEEALGLLRKERPKIVLLDVMMPKKNGYEVCAELKADPELKDIFVVMLTAKGQKMDKQKAMEVGADHYMTKPFDDEEILQILDRLFQDQIN